MSESDNLVGKEENLNNDEEVFEEEEENGEEEEEGEEDEEEEDDMFSEIKKKINKNKHLTDVKKDRKKDDFLQTITNFRNYVTGIEIKIDSNNIIRFSIPSSILPIYLRVAYGFHNIPTLFECEIQLNNFQWNTSPKICNIRIPGKEKYTGKSSIDKAIRNFFSSRYNPPINNFKCLPLFLRDQNSVDYDCDFCHTLESMGFSKSQSILALSLCKNEFESSHTFLITGKYHLEKPFTTVLNYTRCPLLFLILELVECIFNLQYRCSICGEIVGSPCLYPKCCMKQGCISRYFSDGLVTSLLNEIKKRTSKCDLLFSLYSISNFSDFNFQKPPPLKNQKNPEIDPLSKNVINETIKSMPRMAEMTQHGTDSSLKEFIGDKGYYILNWAVLTCQINLIRLPKENPFLSNLSSREIFMTLPYSCDQEFVFSQMRSIFKSKYLWFGCPTDRWHTIVRRRLTNLNVSQIIPDGLLHDDGIYLTDRSDIACAFAKPADNEYINSTLPKQLQLIALCEVISLHQKESSTKVVVNGEDAENVKFKDVVATLMNYHWCYTLLTKDGSLDVCIVRYILVNPNPETCVLASSLKNIPDVTSLF